MVGGARVGRRQWEGNTETILGRVSKALLSSGEDSGKREGASGGIEQENDLTRCVLPVPSKGGTLKPTSQALTPLPGSRYVFQNACWVSLRGYPTGTSNCVG